MSLLPSVEKIEYFLSILREIDAGEIDMQGNDPRLTTEIRKLYDNRMKYITFFNRVLRQDSYLDEDSLKMIQLFLDVQAGVRTLNDKIMDIIDAYSMDDETINRVLEDFGFYKHFLMSLDVKRNFLLDLISFYKRKGTPTTLINVISYLTLLDTEVIEYWLMYDRNQDRFYFRGIPVSQSELAINIGTILMEYESLTEDDPRWRYSLEDIRKLNKDNPAGLPSLSPYFSVAVDIDLNQLLQAILFTSRQATHLYELFKDSPEEYNARREFYFSPPHLYCTILELLLAASYLYTNRFRDQETAAELNDPNSYLLTWNPESNFESHITFLNTFRELYDRSLTNYTTSMPPENATKEYAYEVDNENCEYEAYLVQKDYPLHEVSYQFMKDSSYVMADNRIYISGGRDEDNIVSKFIYEYSPGNNNLIKKTEMPEALYKHNMSYDPSGSHFIIMNGLRVDGTLNDKVYIYSLNGGGWSLLRENDFPRIDAKAVLDLDESTIIVGHGLTYNGVKWIYAKNLMKYHAPTYEAELYIEDVSLEISKYGMDIDKTGSIYIAGGIHSINPSKKSFKISHEGELNILPELPLGLVECNVFKMGEVDIHSYYEALVIGGFIRGTRDREELNSVEAHFNLNEGYEDISFYLLLERMIQEIYEPNSGHYVLYFDDEPLDESLDELLYEKEYYWDVIKKFDVTEEYFHSDLHIRYSTKPVMNNASIIYAYNNEINIITPYRYRFNNELNRNELIKMPIRHSIRYNFRVVGDIKQLPEDPVVYSNDPVYFFHPTQEYGEGTPYETYPNQISKRRQRDEILTARHNIFTQKEAYLNNCTDGAMDILEETSPDFANYIKEILIADDEEFLHNFYILLSSLDSYCRARGIASAFRSSFLTLDDSTIPSVVDDFKPAHSRYTGLTMVYTLRDRIGDAVAIDEFIKQILKIYIDDDRVKITDRSKAHIPIYIADEVGYYRNFDQIYNRTPNSEEDPIQYEAFHLAQHVYNEDGSGYIGYEGYNSAKFDKVNMLDNLKIMDYTNIGDIIIPITRHEFVNNLEERDDLPDKRNGLKVYLLQNIQDFDDYDEGNHMEFVYYNGNWVIPFVN